MRLLLSLLISLVLGVSVHGASGSDTPPTKITSSNSTVTVVFDQTGHTYDLSVTTGGGATNGIQQLNGFGTNTTFNGATVHNGAHVDTNFVGEIQVTNNATILGTNFPVNIASGNSARYGPPTNSINAQFYDVGILTGTNYYWAYTETDLYGNETSLSPLSNLEAITNKSIYITVPLPRAGVGFRKVYRTKSNDTNFYFLCNFGGSWDHFQTVFVDNVADGSLGPKAPATDTTVFKNLVIKDGVKYMATHPTNAGPADLTMLTSDPFTGTFSIDTYGEVFARTVNRPLGAGATPAFGALATATGMGYRQYWVSETNDLGVIQPLEVYQIQGKGKVVGFGPFSIALPQIEDSIFNVGEVTNTAAGGGLHANLRVTSSYWGGGNSIFFGGANTNYLSSLGAYIGSEYPFIATYAHHSSTANNTLMTSGDQAPMVMDFKDTGAARFLGGPANNGSETNVTLTQVASWFASGGFVVGTNTTSPGALNLHVDGNSTTIGTDTAATGDFATLAGGTLTVTNNSTLKGTANVVGPGTALTDSILNVDTQGALGLHAAIRATSFALGDNSIFWGHNNAAYLSTLGFRSGNGNANILFYAYNSTNANNQAYAGTVNKPIMLDAIPSTGHLTISGSALGTADADITWTKGVDIDPLVGQIQVAHLSNVTDIASTTAISQVLSGTNVSVIGGFSADTVDATNGIKSAGTSYIGFGSGAINLTGRLAVTHITNVADLASTTAISQVMSGTNTEFIGAVTADNVHATNGVTSGGFVFKQVSLTQGVSPLADSTNQVLDFSQGMYQIWTLTNDVCFTNFTGSSSAATIKFRPNGANRNVLIDTNWMPVNVQGGTLNGTHYQFVVTNGTTFSVLSAWASGANATNVAAVWANF